MLEYVGCVNRGLVHETNDDAALLNHSIVHNGMFKGYSETEDGIFAVADGVGSIRQSELASREVLNSLRECNPRQIEDIKKRIYQANETLISVTQKCGLERVLSTTLCMVSVLGDSLISYNLGNSRLYRFRDGYLRLLTTDHTKVQELVDAGMLEPYKMKEHPDSNIITRFLGSEFFSQEWLDVVEHSETLKDDDILFLCSDGIHEYVDIDLLEEILSVDATLEELAEVIIRCANDAGGFDNETVVLVRRKA
jgi:protein phosphatase